MLAIVPCSECEDHDGVILVLCSDRIRFDGCRGWEHTRQEPRTNAGDIAPACGGMYDRLTKLPDFPLDWDCDGP